MKIKHDEGNEKIAEELALVERVADWSGHGKTDLAERIGRWAATLGQIAAVAAVAVVAAQVARQAESFAGDWVSLLTVVLGAVFVIMWLHLGTRMMKGLRRHFVLQRALRTLERRLDSGNEPPAGQGRHPTA